MATEIYRERRKGIRKEVVKDVRPTNSERKENYKITASESEKQKTACKICRMEKFMFLLRRRATFRSVKQVQLQSAST